MMEKILDYLAEAIIIFMMAIFFGIFSSLIIEAIIFTKGIVLIIPIVLLIVAWAMHRIGIC